MNKIRSLVVPPVGFAVYSVISYINGNEKYYEKVLMPTIHLFEPELCHNFAVWMCKMGLVPKTSYDDPKCLETSVINFKLKNPIGIAAGFDKHGEAIEALDRMGFGFVEIGSVTPNPQSGNPVPRLFRVPEKLAVINRYGFNSKGHTFVADRIIKLREGGYSGVIGVNLGANKDSPAPVSDYMDGIAKFSKVADYIVINISSPNTPGLRNLQYRNEMTHIMSMVNDMQNNPDTRVPIFIKIAPDITQEMKKDIANIITNSTKNLSGLIICNTTVNRVPGLPSDSSMPGGVSGMPLTDVSTKLIAEMYLLTEGKIPIIGVGGIFSGKDAYDKICAGASAIQIYTSFIYFGPPRITQIKEELSRLLRSDGFSQIEQAKGTKAENYAKIVDCK